MQAAVADSSSCGSCSRSGLRAKEELSLIEEADKESIAGNQMFVMELTQGTRETGDFGSRRLSRKERRADQIEASLEARRNDGYITNVVPQTSSLKETVFKLKEVGAKSPVAMGNYSVREKIKANAHQNKTLFNQ